jgi:hypothetical protein
VASTRLPVYPSKANHAEDEAFGRRLPVYPYPILLYIFMSEKRNKFVCSISLESAKSADIMYGVSV